MTNRAAHILLIDDDPDMHDVVRLILEPAGYRVTCCATSACGLNTLEHDRPDVLLLDIMLATPTEGLDIADRLRASPEYRGVPIIMVSSAPRESGMHQPGESPSLHAEPDLFLEKPLDGKRLRDAVAEVLARSS